MKRYGGHDVLHRRIAMMAAVWIVLGCAMLPAVLHAAEPERLAPMNAADLRIALEKLRVTGTVMYVAAHPDDENTALLAYLAKGKKYRTVYLSLTRGEGGQNILGSEKDAALGIIRTEELLAARRVDGAEQRFTRAVDFGFSKSSLETISFWGRDAIVADIVWAIRSIRPDVVITRFSSTEGGHGNHTASAILAAEAFRRSGDSASYPEQLAFVKPWKAKRLFFNRLTGFGGAPASKEPGDWAIDIGAYNPLLGLSYTEIAGISRSLHKTQAMGSEQRRGKSYAFFRLTDTDSSSASASQKEKARSSAGMSDDDDLLSGVETSWKRYTGATEIEKFLLQSARNFDAEHPDRVLPLLLRVHAQIEALASSPHYRTDPLIAQKREEIAAVIASCLGLHCTARASEQRLVRGSGLGITVDLIARAGVPMVLRAIRSPLLGIDTITQARIQSDVRLQIPLVGSIPESMSPTQPYWLLSHVPSHIVPGSNDTTRGVFHYTVPSQAYSGLPENPDSLVLSCEMTVSGQLFTVSIPIRFQTIDPVGGELYRPVSVVPALEGAFTEKMVVWTRPGTKTIALRVTSNADTDSGSVHLNLPPGFAASPPAMPFGAMRKNESRLFTFGVEADSGSASGAIGAEVRSGTQTFTMYGTDISYPHIVPQRMMQPSQLTAVRAPMAIVRSRIGYIEGSGDDVPSALHESGYDVVKLDDDSLQRGLLSSFDAIVVGVRAYNVRPQVRLSNVRLMDYVRSGGTLVVQYQIPGRDLGPIGPYPFSISRDRVTDENAAMIVAEQRTSDRSQPDTGRTSIVRGLLTVPNTITDDDFSGWVQERGLYFADAWDDRYAAPFLCGDPGEKPKQGSLLVAAYGKGMYCYTGLSFFRQLPAGVPGAYRLLGNLIELKR